MALNFKNIANSLRRDNFIVNRVLDMSRIIDIHSATDINANELMRDIQNSLKLFEDMSKFTKENQEAMNVVHMAHHDLFDLLTRRGHHYSATHAKFLVEEFETMDIWMNQMVEELNDVPSNEGEEA